MKILVAGDWHSELHEEAVFRAFQKLGHETYRFAWHSYFQDTSWSRALTSIARRAQNKYMAGPAVDALNRDLLAMVRDVQPDFVFVYRGTHVYARTVRKMRQAAPGVIIAGYNNDDPFSPQYRRGTWRHFLASVPEYDVTLAYRQHNIPDYRAAGARRVELLRSWFMPERNFPVELTDAERSEYGCDVVFVGHYEDDGRVEILEEVVRGGWTLRLFGPGYEWDEIVAQSSLLAGQAPVRLVWGQDYNRALCGAKIALCFFSKLNRDTYTRRCFEIPASGTLLLSEFTDDVASLFRPNEEAVFFKDTKDLRSALESLLGSDDPRRQIAAAGLRAVNADGHDVVSRMKHVLAWVDEIAGARE